MNRLRVAGLLLYSAAASTLMAHGGLAQRPLRGIGIVCTDKGGEILRFNIDAKRGRYDAGRGAKRLYEVSDTRITIEGPNPDLMTTPMGPVIHTLELDRASLLLIEKTLMPDRNVNKTAVYQCVQGATIDFAAGKKL